ncbi:Homeobox protein ceh-19 [Blattella germanica]|nr:Homeobox protein ceh-19 [Blattella germanica]
MDENCSLLGRSSAGQDERKKRPRTAFTAAQIKSLEAEFEKNKYLSVAKRLQLSKTLKLTETQDAALQMELIELRYNRRLREKFMNNSSTELIEFRRTLPDSQFPNLMRNAAIVMLD